MGARARAMGSRQPGALVARRRAGRRRRRRGHRPGRDAGGPHVDGTGRGGRVAGGGCGRGPRTVRRPGPSAGHLPARHLDRVREPVARPCHRQPGPALHEPPRGAVRPGDALLRGGSPVAAELPRDDVRRDPGGHRRQQRPGGGGQHLRPGAPQRPPVASLRLRDAARLRPAGRAQLIARDLHRPPRATGVLPLDRSGLPALGRRRGRPVEGGGLQRRAPRSAGRRPAPEPAAGLRDAGADGRRRELRRRRRGRPGQGRRLPGPLDPAPHREPRLPRRADRDLHHLGRTRRLRRPAPGRRSRRSSSRRRSGLADGSPRAWTTTRCSARPRTCSACAATSAPQRTPRPCGARSASRHGGPSPAGPRDTSVDSSRGDARPRRTRRVRPFGRRSD